MDRRLLAHYERELRHLRESAAEFAREYPKIAGRLAIAPKPEECPDPYVERLLEGFAFLTARVQLKLEAEFPRFTQGILETIYPHYLAPTPSMAIVQFAPDPAEGSLAEGFRLQRDRVLRSLIGKGDQTPCEYRTAHDVVLYPIEVTKVEYLTRGLAALQAPTEPGDKAGIRIRLRTTGNQPFNKINLDRLTFYLHGADGTPMRLYEQLFAHTRAVAIQHVGNPVRWHEVAPGGSSAVCQVGFSDDQALLPASPRSFQGYRLLHEYFTLPQRFLFVEFRGLAAGLKRCKETEVDLVVLLKSAAIELENALAPESFSLFCSPAINLFPRRADRIHLTEAFNEHHVVPDRTRPLDFEVYEVMSVAGYGESADMTQEFHSFYAARDATADTRGAGGAEGGAYFSVQRVPRTPSAREQLMGARSSYAGGETYVTLVDAASAPYRTELRQLGVEVRCTNRDLPLRMPLGRGRTDFTMEEGAPVASVRCLGTPTPPKPSHVEGETAWRLISHLALNYHSLTDSDAPPSQTPSHTVDAKALRDLLKLYADSSEAHIRKQLDGVRSVRHRAITRRVSTPGPIAFARGLEVSLTFDEAAFEGTGVFVLGAVLEQFFARYVAINSFTETVVRTVGGGGGGGRGEIMRWPARIGLRQAI